MPNEFMKFDGRNSDNPKLMYDLLDVYAIEDLVKVLTRGAQKYSPNNWHNSDSLLRYYAAAMRHLEAWRKGEETDEETGLPHISHAMCCLMFLHGIQRLHPKVDDRFSKDS